MSFIKEFRDFAVKGNALDLAFGVIIGAAFGKIVSSLVSDVIMPFVGVLFFGVNLTELTMTIGSSTVKYGMFIQAIVDFLIISLFIFIMVKQVNRFRKPAPAPSPTRTEQLLTEIRDELKK